RPVRLVDQHVNAFYARADFALELEGVGQDLPDLLRIGIDPNSTDYELRLFELLQPDDHVTASQLVLVGVEELAGSQLCWKLPGENSGGKQGPDRPRKQKTEQTHKPAPDRLLPGIH